ncbi:MAG: 30S ribosome-binding factor RbfA [Bacteroidia bacterium]|nr:30S ribosome-binding factor RbfA [Bacteroidia bacterium]
MSTRTEKFNREMQRELGTIFQARMHDWFEGAFITVTDVSTSPDLGYVKAYLSIYNTKNRQAIMDLVNLSNKQIRKDLASKIRKSVRIIPELTFFEDKSLDDALKFDKIFEQLKEERESREKK